MSEKSAIYPIMDEFQYLYSRANKCPLFADTNIIKPWPFVIDGKSFLTSPLHFGITIDLLDLSGVNKNEYYLDSDIRIDTIYLRIGSISNLKLHMITLIGNAQNKFISRDPINTALMKYKFKESIPVKFLISTEDSDYSKLIEANVDFNITGFLNLETSELELTCAPLELEVENFAELSDDEKFILQNPLVLGYTLQAFKTKI